jgi:hypothetical protein
MAVAMVERRTRIRPAVGETTPAYLFHPHVHRRVAQLLPDSKFIILLRNPIDRAYSSYWHRVAQGHEKLATFEEALRAESDRLGGEIENVVKSNSYNENRRLYSYVTRGLYATSWSLGSPSFLRPNFSLHPARASLRILPRRYGRFAGFSTYLSGRRAATRPSTLSPRAASTHRPGDGSPAISGRTTSGSTSSWAEISAGTPNKQRRILRVRARTRRLRTPAYGRRSGGAQASNMKLRDFQRPSQTLTAGAGKNGRESCRRRRPAGKRMPCCGTWRTRTCRGRRAFLGTGYPRPGHCERTARSGSRRQR